MSPSVHASCVCVGEAGVLIRGPSGAGKSSLATALIETAAARGLFAQLVADDRVLLDAVNGRVIASPPAAIAGLVERRGYGVVQAPHQPHAVVRLVADLAEAVARMPDDGNAEAEIAGVGIPRLVVASKDPAAASLVLLSLGHHIPAARL